MIVSLPLCALVLYHIKDTNYDDEPVMHVEELDAEKVEGVSLPKGHHARTEEGA